jgi:hypothetical protein
MIMTTRKHLGEPCPKCAAPLIRRPKRAVARTMGGGDVAFSAACNAAWELVETTDRTPAALSA